MYETIVEDDDVWATVQWAHGVPFAHLKVYVWSPRVCRKIENIIKAYIVSTQQDLFVAAPVDNAKLHKFCKLMGGRMVGKTSESIVFIWEA
jgi:hypothetical protein